MGWLTRAQAASLSEEQRIDYLTRTVLGEAVGEGYTGMLVVAQVIQNRSEDGRWPSDPVAVAGQSWQFSTNSPGEGGNQGMVTRNYGPGTSQYKMAQAAVRAAIVEQSVPDITGDAKYYHTSAMGWPSSWPSSIKRHGFIDIGAHRVYPDHPVPPGEIPAKLASLQYVDGEVGTFLSVYDERGIKPIRPATMGSATRLTRELNRVAEQKASASETIKRSRAFAFGNTVDPFEVGRPAATDPIINRPVPAMKESMQRQLRATGTPTTTERTFAQLARGEGMDGPSLTLVSSGQRPPAVHAAPWGVREDVAATVAATDAAAGRGQITMTGNPNIAGAVVDWLYPRIEEGQGEANQEGKGPKAVGRSMIERGEARQRDVPQSTIERGRPVVVVEKGRARVVPQSVIERPDVVAQSIDRANKASDPALAASLAASIASRPSSSQIERTKLPAAKPAQSVIERGTPRKGAPTQSQIERGAARAAVVVAQPSGSTAAKDVSRLPQRAAIEFKPVASPPAKLPPVAPPKSNPIGIMPKFSDLNALQPPARLTSPKAPKPASVEDREIARGSPLFGQPVGPTVKVTQPEAVPPMPRNRPANDLGSPATRAVETKRVTTTAPVPASVEDRVTARNRPLWAGGKPVVTTQRPGLSIVVQRDRPAVKPQPIKPAVAAPAKPRSQYYTDPVAFGNASVAQSGDTSVGSQADAAAARASGDAWREAQSAKSANDLWDRMR